MIIADKFYSMFFNPSESKSDGFFCLAAINFVLRIKLFIDSVFLMGYTEGVICGRIFLMFKDIRIL